MGLLAAIWQGATVVAIAPNTLLVKFLKATAPHCPNTKPRQTQTPKDLPEKEPDLWEVEGCVQEYLDHVFRVSTLKVRKQATAYAEIGQDRVQQHATQRRAHRRAAQFNEF